ncbi:PDZ domain-containing protein [Paenibacillus thermoaerophilus]|uniref:PDZ domain-containing protein n=1 Tax=Paenibacillus thermoaerophilus TaxID=1215385 RepID=A0ABW2V2E2_9BACL|nr:PDZ domain-containing protein [Paenibacillus thermoaerophilus]
MADRRTSTGYHAGFGIAAWLVWLGLTVWLPDPLRIGGVYWIEMLDSLVYASALPALIWGWTAAAGLRRIDVPKRTAGRLLRASKLAAAAACAGAVVLLPWGLDHLVPYAVLYGAAFAAVLADLVLDEWLRRGRRWRAAGGAAIWLLTLVLLLWPTPYMVTYPGITMNMHRYAQAEGAEDRSASSLTGVLVFERPAFPIDWLSSRLFPHYSFEPIEKLGMSLGEYDTLVRMMKADANTLASAVALGKLGIGSGVRKLGAEVTAVLRGGAADGLLRPGDVITMAEGRPVGTVGDLTDAMRGVAPGRPVHLSVVRDGRTISVTSGTKAHPDDANRAALGIQVQDAYEPDVPRNVAFRDFLLHEGGPSHGAMLALAIIDQLTPGGVLRGNRVAGTGTIEPDGSVGKIGGIEQKAYTVSRSGADVFFVPEGQEQDARKGAPGLEIVPVRTLDDILAWLEAHPKKP